MKSLRIFQHDGVISVSALFITPENMFHPFGGKIHRQIVFREQIRSQVCAVGKAEKFSWRINRVHMLHWPLIKGMGLIYDDPLIFLLEEADLFIGQLSIVIDQIQPCALRQFVDFRHQLLIDRVEGNFCAAVTACVNH